MTRTPQQDTSPVLRAALFDLDGTLIETHIDFPLMTDTVRQLALSAGTPSHVIDGKDILAMVHAASDDITTRGGDGTSFTRTAFAELEALEVSGCAHPVLLPGTSELLTELRAAGVRIGIVTRNCRHVSAMLVKRHALPYDVLLTRDDVPRTKPDPAHLWEALKQLGCEASQSVMVGDHWMDIQAGQEAGCALTIGVLGTHGEDWFALCPPTALMPDLREAPALLLPRVALR